MARSIRSSSLETRTARLKLAQRKKPYTARIAPGVRLAYRRRLTAGRWIVFGADGAGGSWERAFADADDFEDANGETILDFWQATARRGCWHGVRTASRPIAIGPKQSP